MTRSPLRKPTRRATPPRPQAGMALHTLDGARKYLTTGERDAFLRAAEQADRQVRTRAVQRSQLNLHLRS